MCIVSIVVLALATLYTGLILAFWAPGTGDFNSLDGVGRLFQHRGLLLAGWVHYLAFDLLIGLWERTEAKRIGLPHLLLAPCLVCTFLFGPIGWLLFKALCLYHQNVHRTRSATAA